MSGHAIILSCEHASQHVPRRFAARFRGAGDVLASHRGHDIGAAWLARWLARRLGAPLFLGGITRLLVDLNRSLHHRHAFSSSAPALPAGDRALLVERYYRPYRDAVTAAVRARLRAGQRVLHVAVHSFTPVLDGTARTADVGLLYDPGRASERALCHAWQDALRALAPGIAVRRNYPYRGVADGFTTSLRRQLATPAYAGVELEVSQRHLGAPGPARRALAAAILAALQQACTRVPRAAWASPR
jgi:predicted N-formylglutamate amidohydrolase